MIGRLLIYFSVWIFFSLSPIVCRTGFPEIELNALQDLYNSTNGDYWIWYSNYTQHGIPWNFSVPNPNPCDDNWQGLTCIGDCNRNLCRVTIIDLQSHNLTGYIPTSFVAFNLLSAIIFSNNSLTGSLPASIGTFPEVEAIYFSSNHFTGVIPPEIGNASKLTHIDFYNNYLEGSVPDNFWNLIHLKTLDISTNHLTGTIPSSIGNLRNLLNFQINDNNLHGSIPPTIGQLKNLTGFQIGLNHFTGTILSELGSLPLEDLFLDLCLFTGTIPQSFSNLTQLLVFDIYGNFLTGSIPDGLDKIQTYQVIFIGHNHLTGTISSGFFNSSIQSFHLEHNLFTGTIPDLIQNKSYLRELNMSSNYFTGSIPLSLGNAHILSFIDLSSNSLSGSISTDLFAYTNYLAYLFLHNNMLAGSLGFLIPTSYEATNNVTANSTFATSIQNIDISNNRFSGTLPSKIFQSPSLISFAVVKNCLTGSLPSDDICASQSLISLALDGLNTAETCIHYFFPESFHIRTYPISNPLKGNLPSCLFNISTLETLHLSGNGLHGSLPSHISSNSKLTDLSLSHNLLTGTIPHSFQEKNWSNLDLSFNKLTGYLTEHIYSFDSSNVSLILKVNRLSGPIPKTIRESPSIDILQGNVFDCHNYNSLPDSDSDKFHYRCGSDDVNMALYYWLIVIGFVIAFLIIYIWCSSDSSSSLTGNAFITQFYYWYDLLININSILYQQLENYPNLQQTHLILRLIRRFIIYASMIVLFLFSPVYILLSIFYGTYQSQYAWTLSLIYLSGFIPAIILFFMFKGFFLWIQSYFQINIKEHFQLTFRNSDIIIGRNESSTSRQESVSSNILIDSPLQPQNSRTTDTIDPITSNSPSLNPLQATSSNKQTWTLFSQLIGFICFNCLVVLVVNLLYAYAYTSNINANTFSLFALLLTFFKIVWNSSVVLGYFADYVHITFVNNHSFLSLKAFSLILLNLTIYNNVLAPFLAEALISSDCLYYVFKEPSSVSSIYSFTSCTTNIYFLENSYCTNPYQNHHSETYNPPFLYSYQCSSTLVTSFALVFIYRYLMTGVVIPTIHICIKLYLNRQREYQAKHGINRSMTFLERSLESLLPEALKLTPPLTFDPSITPQTLETVSPIVTDQISTNKDIERNESSELPENRIILFNKNRFFITFLGDIAVFLTFGVTFPPIAVTICVSIIVNTLFTQFMHGRLVTLSKNFDQFKRYVTQINEECQGASQIVLISLPWIAMITSTFWAFFLYDTLGDQQGIQALWIFFLTFLLPVITYLCHRLYSYLLLYYTSTTSPPSTRELPSNLISNSSNDRSQSNSTRSTSIELRVSSINHSTSSSTSSIP